MALLMFPMCDSLSRVVVLGATVTIIHKQVFELHGASRKRQLSKKHSSSTEFAPPAGQNATRPGLFALFGFLTRTSAAFTLSLRKEPTGFSIQVVA
jgi:hypothetical protein